MKSARAPPGAGDGALTSTVSSETIPLPVFNATDAAARAFDQEKNANAGAGPSRSSQAPSVRHTAKLGPTGFIVPTAPLANPVPAPTLDRTLQQSFHRGPEEKPEGHRLNREEETLRFFNDAAAGYDFDKEGEAALQEALAPTA